MNRVLESVVGYDLNPIAVATTRLNYTLVLVDTLQSTTLREPFRLPVYLADSLRLPELTGVGTSPHFLIPTRVGEFQVPILRPGEPPEVTVRDTQRLLRVLRDNCTKPTESFLAAVRTEVGPEAVETQRPLLIKLHEKIHELHVDKRNGLWASILENFFAPRLQGRFPFVVGNPPWVIPRRTPKSYTEKVRWELAQSPVDSLVLAPAKKDFTRLGRKLAPAEKQYFACTPFVWRSLRSYVQPAGKLAFLMTSSMFSVIASGGYRRWVTQFEVEKIIDMSLVTDIHEGALCWSYVPVIKNTASTGSTTDFEFGTPLTADTGSDGDDRRLKWTRWKARIKDIPATPTRVIESDTHIGASEAPWLIAPPKVLQVIRKMQAKAGPPGLGRLGDQYPVSMGFKADGWKLFLLRTEPTIKGKVATARNALDENVTVETDFVFPVTFARGLRPFGYKFGHAVLPLDPDGSPLEEKELEDHPLLRQFLVDHRRLLEARRFVTQGYAHAWFGIEVPNAVRSRPKVACRLISKQLEASTLPAQVDFLGKKKLLLPDQSIRFMPVNDEAEALYIGGLLNSGPIRTIAYLLANPKGGVPTRQLTAWNVAFLPCITYDSKSEECQVLAGIGREIANAPATASGRQPELDSQVAKIFGLSSDDLKQLSTHRRLMMGSRSPERGVVGPDE